MRFLILSLLLFLAACSNNKTNNEQEQPVAIDTAKLFDPQPGTADEVGNVLTNCVMLDDDSMAVVTNGEKYSAGDNKKIGELLQSNSEAISKQKFYIVYAGNIATKKIMDIIDIIKAAGINNYKVVKLDALFKMNALEMNVPK